MFFFLKLWNSVQVKPHFSCLLFPFISSPVRKASSLFIPIVVVSILFTSCSLFGQTSNPTPTVPIGIGKGTATQTQEETSLSSLHWCGKPLVLFQDDGAAKGATATASPTPQATPKTVTDWTQVEPNLGFTVYLPQMLPVGTCLTSVYGTFHDPVLGGSFTIGYLLPDHTAISFSEAPLVSRNTQFQCSPSSTTGTPSKTSTTPTPGATVVPLQLCTGAQGSTSIVLSAHGDSATLQKFFNALQPHVNWQPTS